MAVRSSVAGSGAGVGGRTGGGMIGPDGGVPPPTMMGTTGGMKASPVSPSGGKIPGSRGDSSTNSSGGSRVSMGRGVVRVSGVGSPGAMGVRGTSDTWLPQRVRDVCTPSVISVSPTVLRDTNRIRMVTAGAQPRSAPKVD